jgi:hypothetical protein
MEDDMKITSVWEFLKAVDEIPRKGGSSLYYRGHIDASYKLEPSLFRSANRLNREHSRFREILKEEPRHFLEDKTTFEKLVKMQHFGLPTRLLDITKNPLVALYFACVDSDNKTPEKTDGEVVVLSLDGKLIQYDDSDAVLVLSNLCKLKPAEKQFDVSLSVKEFNKTKNVEILCSEIKREKSVFNDTINPKHINRVLPVKAAKSNERIQMQDGLFLLFGAGDGEKNVTIPGEWIARTKPNERIFIDAKSKVKIRKQLEDINISQKILFPSLDTATTHIVKRS